MFKQMVRILSLDEDVIRKTERLIAWLLGYDIKVKRASEALRVYGLWNGVMREINQAFFGEEMDEEWAEEILREIYFMVCAVDKSPGSRFIKIP